MNIPEDNYTTRLKAKQTIAIKTNYRVGKGHGSGATPGANGGAYAQTQNVIESNQFSQTKSVDGRIEKPPLRPLRKLRPGSCSGNSTQRNQETAASSYNNSNFVSLQGKNLYKVNQNQIKFQPDTKTNMNKFSAILGSPPSYSSNSYNLKSDLPEI